MTVLLKIACALAGIALFGAIILFVKRQPDVGVQTLFPAESVIINNIKSAPELPDRYSESAGLIADAPFLPDFDEMPLKELPFDPMKLLGKELEVSYKTASASAAFLAEMDKLTGGELEYLGNNCNFVNIGEYLLYYTMDSPMGSSKLQIEAPNGSVETLIDSLYAIQGMFFMDRETLYIDFATLFHFEGGEGQYYSFNLRTGEVEKTNYAPTMSALYANSRIHRKKIFLVAEAEGAEHFYEAHDIYISDENGEYSQIIKYAIDFVFYGNYIYYLTEDGLELYKIDLNGQNKALLCSFKNKVEFIGIVDDCLYYDEGEGSQIIRIADEFESRPESHQLKEIDKYSVNADRILEYVSDDGYVTPIFNNFNVGLFAVKDDWIYFRDIRSGDIERYSYRKIKRDGTELTAIN